MKVVRIYNLKNSSVLCFFDVEIIEGMVIKGFKLCAGDRGNFVSGPSYKKEDGQYQNISWIREPASSNLLTMIESLYKSKEEGSYNVVDLDKGRGVYMSEVGTKRATPLHKSKMKEEGMDDLPF